MRYRRPMRAHAASRCACPGPRWTFTHSPARIGVPDTLGGETWLGSATGHPRRYGGVLSQRSKELPYPADSPNQNRMRVMIRPALAYFVAMFCIYAWLSFALVTGKQTAAMPLVGQVDALAGLALTTLMTLIGVAVFIVPHLVQEEFSGDYARYKARRQAREEGPF